MVSLLHDTISQTILSRRSPMRVLLADDDPKALSAMHLVIGSEPGMVVVGEAADVQSIRSQVARHLPDLLLVDWALPGLQPSTFLQRLRELFPALKVVALSSQPEDRQPALAAGADAFVSRGDAPERLLLALHRLAASADT